MKERLFTVREAAVALSVSSQTLARLVRAGELPVVRIGSRVLFRPADLEDFVDRHSRLVGAMEEE